MQENEMNDDPICYSINISEMSTNLSEQIDVLK